MKDIKRAKTFALKADGLAENRISGIASVAGVLDSYNDVILPGAFGVETLTDFLATGFVAANHDWREIVAMPLVAEVRGNDLYTEAEFHSTEDAQSLRIKCAERIDRGLAVGLSIGFTMNPGDYKSFASGDALLKWAMGAGYDMRTLDTAPIAACTRRCQAIVRVAKLYEYSIVSAPANPESWAGEVKADLPESIGTGLDSLRYFKGEYLGQLAEAEAAWSALNDLTYSLKYRALWDAVFASGECAGMDSAARLKYLAGAYAEYSRISLAIAAAILPLMPEAPPPGEEADEDYLEMSAKLRAALETRFPAIDTISLNSLPAGVLGEHAQAALAVAKAFTDRLAGLHDLRAKEGRTLSETNRERAAQLRDALADCAEKLGELSEAPAPACDTMRGQTDPLPEMIAAHLRARQELLRDLAAA